MSANEAPPQRGAGLSGGGGSPACGLGDGCGRLAAVAAAAAWLLWVSVGTVLQIHWWSAEPRVTVSVVHHRPWDASAAGYVGHLGWPALSLRRRSQRTSAEVLQAVLYLPLRERVEVRLSREGLVLYARDGGWGEGVQTQRGLPRVGRQELRRGRSGEGRAAGGRPALGGVWVGCGGRGVRGQPLGKLSEGRAWLGCAPELWQGPSRLGTDKRLVHRRTPLLCQGANQRTTLSTGRSSSSYSQ